MRLAQTYRFLLAKKEISKSDLFDLKWYEAQYGIPQEKAVEHYIREGAKMLLDPSKDFSTQFYFDRYDDIQKNGVNPLYHYLVYGKAEGREIAPAGTTAEKELDELIPEYVYPKNRLNGKSNVEIVSDSAYFNRQWYKWRHLFSSALFSPEAHYLKYGFSRLYDPSPNFSGSGFLFLNPSIVKTEPNPLVFFEMNRDKLPRIMDRTQAQKNIRAIKRSPYFKCNWYKRMYGVAGTKTNAAKHYFGVGIASKYNPGKDFSTAGYYLLNGVYGVNPLVHADLNCSAAIVMPPKSPSKELSLCMFPKTEEPAESKNCCRMISGTVNVVICIHNALEDVKLCVESVVAKRSYPYSVTLVNDNSNEDTVEYLKNIESQYDFIRLIHNDTDNHGYTYSANIGLRNSSADYTVMLNSDTIVTNKWIEKMLNCFCSNPDIGIVGPLSNTASWQSVPNLTDGNGDWAHNKLPEGMSVDEFGALVEDNSPRLYPTVPLLNGFCLMISRKTVEKIGYFDEESFGRGFAEEDDYNIRAGKAGILLAIADDTYIYHAQSKSYSDSKRHELCEISGRVLREKHGEELINEYCALMVNSYILDSNRKRIAMNIRRAQEIKSCTATTAKSIAFILPCSEAGGGSNIVISEAMALKKMGMDVTLINLEVLKPGFKRAYPNLELKTVYVEAFDEVESLADDYDYIVCTLYSTVKYCTFNGKRAKIVYYIQDFEPFFSEKGTPDFEEALESYTMIEDAILVTKTCWNRDMVKKWTGKECHVIGPSVNLNLCYPRRHTPTGNIVRISAMVRPSSERRAPGKTLEILRRIKNKYGEAVTISIFGNDPERDSRDFTLFCTVPQDFEYENHGKLTQEKVAELLGGTDIFVDFSAFQAMGLTAMEAMCSGCAVVMTKYGGPSEFVTDGQNALLVDTMNAEECKAAVCRLVDDKAKRSMLSVNAYTDMMKYYPEKAAGKLFRLLNE